METIVAIAFVAVVAAVVYKMMTKKETVEQATAEVAKEVVEAAKPVVEQAAAKVEEEVKQVVEKVKKSRKKKAE